jgi:hypothetical protein
MHNIFLVVDIIYSLMKEPMWYILWSQTKKNVEILNKREIEYHQKPTIFGH